MPIGPGTCIRRFDSTRSYGTIVRIKQYQDRQRHTPTRPPLMHCGVWALVYEGLRRRTGPTPRSHPYGHAHCPFGDRADTLATPAAATHPLQWVAMCTAKPGAGFGPTQRPAMSAKKERRRCSRGSSSKWASFGTTAALCTAHTEGAIGPFGVSHCSSKTKCNTGKGARRSVSANASFGVPTGSVNASGWWWAKG